MSANRSKQNFALPSCGSLVSLGDPHRRTGGGRDGTRGRDPCAATPDEANDERARCDLCGFEKHDTNMARRGRARYMCGRAASRGPRAWPARIVRIISPKKHVGAATN